MHALARRARSAGAAPARWRALSLQPHLEPGKALAAAMQQRARRMASSARRHCQAARAHALPGRAAPAASAARWRRRSGGNAHGYWLSSRGAGRRRPHRAAAAGSPAVRSRRAARGPRRAIRCGGFPGRAASTPWCGARGCDLDEQFAAHRHRHFGGRRRRRRALVGGEIDQRDVGLVADRRDQRDHALGRGADHDLLVERPEILQRAAAARDDQQIRPRNSCRPRAAR